MKLLALTCNNCGAPIEVPEETKFFTCSHCESRLAVHRSGNAVYTDVLDALQQRAIQIATDMEVLKVQDKLGRLDRQWGADREKLGGGQHGYIRVPTVANAVAVRTVLAAGGILVIVLSLLCTSSSLLSGNAAGLAMLGVFLIFAGLLAGHYGVEKADEYQRKKRIWQRRRGELLQVLSDLQERSD